MSAIAATRVCISLYRQVHIAFLSTELLTVVGYVAIQLSSRFCVKLCKNYVTPVALLFSPE